uniref:Uncharacterized protein n=1 Tax=Anguilla anguilla TaxID=7936 RepID=A0A0E9QJ47_ANGAN
MVILYRFSHKDHQGLITNPHKTTFPTMPCK